MILNMVYSNFSQTYSQNIGGDNLKYDFLVCARKLALDAEICCNNILNKL